MGMDAKAYLWFGIKPSSPDERPSYLPSEDEDAEGDLVDQLRLRLEEKKIKLINVPSSEGDGLWALAILASYKHHDWDFDAKKFEMYQPTEEDKALLIKEAAELGYEVSPDELGWYMGATYW